MVEREFTLYENYDLTIGGMRVIIYGVGQLRENLSPFRAVWALTDSGRGLII
ncbi:MAG: hypothetical protein K2P33_06680 [Acutalibacter sp.]|nr:hypothetical protein [Acutalibacter sp.]